MKKIIIYFFLLFIFAVKVIAQIPTLPPGVKFPDNISDADCFVIPKGFIWDIAKKYQSAIRPASLRVQSYANLLVGDLDSDGKPEIITLNFSSNVLFSSSILIFNNDLTLKKEIPVPVSEVYVTLPLAIGDVNNDGIPEIIYGTGIRYVNNTNLLYRLQAYQANGTLVWTSSDSYISTYNSSYFHSASVSIADLDGDGMVEIFAGDRIFAGETGNLLATLPTTPMLANPINMNTCGRGLQLNASSNNTCGYLPAIGDVDGDGIQEIACGNTTYKIKINSRTNPASNTVTVVGQIDMVDGYTSLADIDGDGLTDVVVVGRPTNGSDSQMYVWSGVGTTGNKIGQTVWGSSYKLQNGDPGYNSAYAASYGKNGSRPFIGDIDGDGKPEIAYTSFALLGIFSYDPATKQFIRRFRTGTTDTSAATTLSLFDFNQDGKTELVYRDETDLRIMQFSDNGSGGFNCTETSFACWSGTHTEYPVIADIDGDGHAEIIVSGTDPLDRPYGDRNNNVRIMVFGSPTNSWASARKVWNQHGYNALNVNENLTIPAKPMSPTTRFPGPDGILGNGDDVWPFNNFLQQQTTLSKWGTLLWLAANAQFVNLPKYNYNKDTDQMKITIDITNIGDSPFLNPFYITVYKDSIGNPIKYTHTFNKNGSVNSIEPNDTITVSFTLNNFKTVWNPNNGIFINLNDDGNGNPKQNVCDEVEPIYYYPLIPTNQDDCADIVDKTLTCPYASASSTFQWQISHDRGITWENIPGATSRNYTTDQDRGTKLYRVIVKLNGTKETISDVVTVRMRSCQMPINHNISLMN